MDPHFGPLNSSNGFQLENQSMAEFSNREIGDGLRLEITSSDQKLVDGHSLPNHPFSNGTVSTSFADIEDDYYDDCEFSDGILRYIDQILMEEEMEDKTHMLQESLDFQAKERSFYEVLGKKYPPSPLQESARNSQYSWTPDNNYSYVNYHNSTTSNSDGSGYSIDVVDPSWRNTGTDYDAYRANDIVSNSSISSSNSFSSVMDRFSVSPVIPLQTGDVDSEVVRSFKKGFDDASKFLPSGSKMLDINGVLDQHRKEGKNKVENNEEKIKDSHFEARGKKNHHEESDSEDERSNKLDDVLLYKLDECEKKSADYDRTELQNAGSKSLQQSGAKGRRCKKQNRKKEEIDLTSLMINCAQFVAEGDHRTANELLKQIRQHSSPFGDGSQRLAHYFADGLEARLAGTGSEIHKALVYRRTIASDYMKAFCTFLVSSPFGKIPYFASNKLIAVRSEKAMRVHIIDFGILCGFQWSNFIQCLAEREGGPPKLRITGIDFPQSGLQPADRVEDAGRWLARHAKTFNVPFEYNAIAQKWETIKVEDLEIEKGEFVAVNCYGRAKNVLDDETVVKESSRTMVLNLIRKINPDIFIHGIVNASYGLPYFLTRFREAWFHFSAIFDMLETTIPREKPERLLIERDIFGKEALNVIACEGWERVIRPETYKQWQVRHLRAGFMKVPFDRKLMDTVMYKARNFYHRDFVVDEDDSWLLMSWKGRTIYAISCWQPV